jgi:hypothetical protein
MGPEETESVQLDELWQHNNVHIISYLDLLPVCVQVGQAEPGCV